MKSPLNITRLLTEVVLAIAAAEVTVTFVLPLIAPGAEGPIEASLHAALLSLVAGPVILWRMQAAMFRSRTLTRLQSGAGAWRTAFAVTVVLLLGLGATGAASIGAAREVHDEARVQFDRLTDRLTDETQRRVNQIRFGLAGARGAYASVGELNRDQFDEYVASRNLTTDFPGAIGIGFIERVARSDLDAFIARERADGVPEFAVYSLAEPDSPLSKTDDLFVVKHCFPQSRNARSWGLDIGSEIMRREAAERSVRTGEPSISGRIELVQDDRGRTAFLYYLPVYRKGTHPTSPQERLDALVGLVFAPIILDEAIDGAADSVDHQLDFEIFDGRTSTSSNLLYDYDGHLEHAHGAIGEDNFKGKLFSSSRTVHVGGREWTMHTSTNQKFEASIDRNTPAVIAIGGCVLCMALAGFALSVLTGRSRAIALAEEMTSDLSDAKTAAEEAIRETAAFRGTLDQHSIISVADHKGRIIDVNPQFCRISGYSREELLGMDHRILNSGEHPKQFWKTVWKTLASGQAWRGEVCNRAKNGSLYWVDSIIAPFVNAEGAIEKYVSIRSDITARKQGEAELVRISERLSLATQIGGVGIWEYDVAHNQVEWDDQMFRLYGIPKHTSGVAYEAWSTGVHPEDRERSHEEIQAALRGEKDFDTEFRVVHPDGTVCHIQAIATVQRDEAGNAVRMVGTNWDVTDQRLAASELQSATTMLEEAQSVARMGNWTFDLFSGKITWSQQLYKLFGRNPAEGPPDFEGVLSDYDEPSAEALRVAVAKAATNGDPYSLVLRTSRPESGVRFVRGEGRARYDSGGSVVGLFGTAMDVTSEIEIADSLKQARVDAEAASRSKSAFLANMSHEIRTPLTSILGFAELLREGDNFETDPKRRSQAIETIHNAGNHLLTVINDILDLSKIEAEKMTVETIETPLISILRDIDSMMRPRAYGKGIALDTVLGAPIPDRIMSDPTRLRQILMNLIGNAIKFTESGGVRIIVHSETREQSERLIITIDDTGPGLNQSQADKLFQTFGQVNETVTRKHGGTGLGLTICRRLAGLMGGTVRLTRTAPGQGCCFEVDLPLKSVPGSAMVNRMEAIDPHAAQATEQREVIHLNGRILLAEDGPDNQRLISFHLRKAGAQVEIADNGQIALEMIDRAAASETPFDLLLTDMQMPEMDGYTLARTLRQRGSSLAIVALTAHAMAEDRARCQAAGCDDYASKPIDRDVLLAVCATWMRKPGGNGTLARSA